MQKNLFFSQLDLCGSIWRQFVFRRRRRPVAISGAVGSNEVVLGVPLEDRIDRVEEIVHR